MTLVFKVSLRAASVGRGAGAGLSNGYARGGACGSGPAALYERRNGRRQTGAIGQLPSPS
jgi:hypothetical protein